MKMKVNFIFSAETARKLLSYAVWTMSVVLLVLIFFMLVDGKKMKEKIPEIKTKIASMEGELAALPHEAGPGETLMEGLISKVAAINRLKIGRSQGAGNILSAFENISPVSLNFISFQYSLEDRMIVIEARAGSQETMQSFISNTEKSPLFKNVLLEKQSQKVSASGMQAIDFTLKAEENLR
jgi:hypothetical protein